MKNINFLRKTLSLGICLLLFDVGYSVPAFAESARITVNQQNQQIKGSVKDANGEALIGVSIMLKGATTGTITDLDGNFTLSAPENSTLLFSYIGYSSLEVKVTNKTKLDIVLHEDTQTLDEVIVVGYGVQKKANLTGSVASISADKLESRSVASVSAALAGQMPGVTIVQGSGAPGLQTGTITIRGKNSINAASPLVIVDGVPGSMNNIDPQDIQSLTVLKDAASAAIYGVQAANGVILITTKQGKLNSKAVVKYSGSVSYTSPTAMFDFLGAGDYAMLTNEAVHNENPNAPLPYTDEDIQKYRDGSDPIGHPNTDWYDATFKKQAFEQMHNISISGGSKNTTFNTSVGYLSQDGFTDSNTYSRYNLRSNINSKINKYITTGINFSTNRGIRKDNWDSYAALRQYSNRLSPTYSVYDKDGEFAFDGLKNPVALNGRTGNRKVTTQQLNAIFHATVQILPELSVKGVYSIRYDDQNSEGFKKHYTYGGSTDGPREGYDNNSKWNAYTTQFLVNYNKDFGDHTVAGLLGFEQKEDIYKYTNASRKGGGNDELSESLNTLDASSQKNADGGNEIARRSYFGRIQYDYKDRYLFEANVRWDASSRFPDGQRWGCFPAFSAGWRVSEEAFVKDNFDWISNLKLRAGWGRTGNEEIRDIYPAIATYAYDKYMFGNKLYSTTYESRYVNPILQWATVTNYELGVDAGFLNNTIGFELSLYKKKTDDMLLKLPVSGLLGLSAPAQNAGTVENTGFDLSIYHSNQINKDLGYAVNLNIAYVKNEITNLSGTEGANPNNNRLWFLEGHSIGSYYGYKAIGFYNTEEELSSLPKRTGKEKLGDIKYADLNNDGKIDAANDRCVIGKDFPSWTGGVNLTTFYKDFDLSILLQGAFDVDGYYTGEAAYAFFNSGKVLDRHLDRWTPTNHNASYPRITKSSQINFSTSSFWLQNASYIRLKNISVGYNFPASIIEKIGVSKLKVYLSGENLLTLTDLEGIDPEGSSGRGAYYGNVKKVSLGLKVSF